MQGRWALPRARKQPAGLVEVAEAGDRLATLRALRATLASTLASADPPQVAALARQLQAVLAEIAALEQAAPQEVDPVDELTRRRADRIAGASGDGGAAGGQQRRRRGGGAG
jgi:hypothetical protein